jgi:type VI protein secretion system component Hcp
MTRHLIVIALAALVSLSAIAHADAGTKKSHASMNTITFTKHYDKASPVLF